MYAFGVFLAIEKMSASTRAFTGIARLEEKQLNWEIITLECGEMGHILSNNVYLLDGFA